MRHKWVKVAITIEKRDAIHDATGSDQCVNGLVDCDALRAQGAKVLGGLNSTLRVGNGDLSKACQVKQATPVFVCRFNPLKNFDQDEVTNDHI
jgi:hypothetical protein